MLDDRENTPGDLVHDGNIAQWKQKFCEQTGHSMLCIDETVADMASIMAKACIAFGGIPPGDILEHMPVEVFDTNIRAILKNKKCNCND